MFKDRVRYFETHGHLRTDGETQLFWRQDDRRQLESYVRQREMSEDEGKRDYSQT